MISLGLHIPTLRFTATATFLSRWVLIGWTTAHRGCLWRERTICFGWIHCHRIPQIFLAAEGIATMVVDGVVFEETGLPRPLKTTRSQSRIDEVENKVLKNVPESRSPPAKL